MTVNKKSSLKVLVFIHAAVLARNGLSLSISFVYTSHCISHPTFSTIYRILTSQHDPTEKSISLQGRNLIRQKPLRGKWIWRFLF